MNCKVPDLRSSLGKHMAGGGQDLACKRALHRKVCDDDAITLVLAPSVKELSGEAVLQHGGGCQHHAWAHIVQAALGLQLSDVLEVEGVGALRHSSSI